MPTNLPTELLRSLVAIVDSGSMLRATEKVFVTQSALSLQMKRLEETVQASIFQKDGRRLALTPAGETLLAFAREMLATNDRAVSTLSGEAPVGPVRVGLVQDFAETMLAGVLARFVRLHADAQLQVKVAGSYELHELLASDKLDLVLGFGSPDDLGSARPEPMRWFGEPALADQSVLPIAVLEKPCRFRAAMLESLERGGRPYRLVLETPSLSALRAAVEAGLGLTVRTAGFLPDAPLIDAIPALPRLPRVSYVLTLGAQPHPTVQRLAELMKASVAELEAIDERVAATAA